MPWATRRRPVFGTPKKMLVCTLVFSSLLSTSLLVARWGWPMVPIRLRSRAAETRAVALNTSMQLLRRAEALPPIGSSEPDALYCAMERERRIYGSLESMLGPSELGADPSRLGLAAGASFADFEQRLQRAKAEAEPGTSVKAVRCRTGA